MEEERGLQFMVNYIKSKPQNKFVFKFYLCKSARRVPQLPAAHGTLVRLMSSGRHAVTRFCDRMFECIYTGITVREHRVQNLGSSDQSGAGDGPQKRGEGRPWTLTSSPTFGVFTEEGLISTLFPCSHSSRCEAGLRS